MLLVFKCFWYLFPANRFDIISVDVWWFCGHWSWPPSSVAGRLLWPETPPTTKAHLHWSGLRHHLLMRGCLSSCLGKRHHLLNRPGMKYDEYCCSWCFFADKMLISALGIILLKKWKFNDFEKYSSCKVL